MRESVFTHTTPPPFAARVCCAVAGLETGAPLPGVPEGVAAAGAAGLLAVAGDAAGVSDGVCAAASACFGFLSFLAGWNRPWVTLAAVNSRAASSATCGLFMRFIPE